VTAAKRKQGDEGPTDTKIGSKKSHLRMFFAKSISIFQWTQKASFIMSRRPLEKLFAFTQIHCQKPAMSAADERMISELARRVTELESAMVEGLFYSLLRCFNTFS
jgi:hypothetical protein